MCSSCFQFVGVKSFVGESLGDVCYTCILLWKTQAIECLFALKEVLAMVNETRTRNQCKKETGLLVGLYLLGFFLLWTFIFSKSVSCLCFLICDVGIMI